MRSQQLANALSQALRRTSGQSLCVQQRRWCASVTDQSQSVDPRETAKFEADADLWCARPRCLARWPGAAVSDTWLPGGTHGRGLSRRCTP